MRPLAILVAAILLGAVPHNSTATLAPLRVQGTHFVNTDGSAFQWRGITAFRLLEYVADGQEARAREFLQWAHREHLTVLRVFSMLHGYFDLSAPRGQAALPRLLALASAEGIRVEVVGLTNTAEGGVDPTQHVRELGRIADSHNNVMLELANEPVHPTQTPDAHRPEYLQGLAAIVPRSVPVSLGSVEGNDGFAAGMYITWHVPRLADEDGWGHVLAVAEGAELVRRFGKPVISDEPIGAGPILQPGRRDNDPNRFRAAALLTRLAGLGATFHYEGGLHAQIPAGSELACFNAWNEAWSLLPPDVEQRGTFRRAGEDGAAVRGFERQTALAVFERQDPPHAWVLVVRPAGVVNLQWSTGWKSVTTRRAGGVEVITAEKQ